MDLSAIPLVILAGGEGSRYRNTVFENPKVLAQIGSKPILWHIIKHYEYYGVKKVILCLGYKHELIGDTMTQLFHDSAISLECFFTGNDTPTGGRIHAVKEHIKSPVFFVTYGDGLSSIPVSELLSTHLAHGKDATISVVRRESPFGQVVIDEQMLVTGFDEKPMLPFWINAGFFVFNQNVLDRISADTVLETMLFKKLLESSSLMSYIHRGFWKSMDTVKEQMQLEEIWQTGRHEWKIKLHEALEKE